MLKTEMRNPLTAHIDSMSTLDMVRVINEENKRAVASLDDCLSNIALAIDSIAERMSRGGRLFYVGAGTSGRLGVLDASECPPTFGVSHDTVIGIIAGGDRALRFSSESREDSAESGVSDLAHYEITELDSVVGISASGSAAYVIAAVEYARARGCLTVSITSNGDSALDRAAEICIDPDTGAEVITGSTRMKAGTAQKLILNMLSTCVMIKLGYVYENLMINLKPTNIKLRRRVISITAALSGADEAAAVAALDASDWDIRSAVDMLKKK